MVLLRVGLVLLGLLLLEIVVDGVAVVGGYNSCCRCMLLVLLPLLGDVIVHIVGCC